MGLPTPAVGGTVSTPVSSYPALHSLPVTLCGAARQHLLSFVIESETKKSPDTVTFEQSRDLLKSGLSDLVAPSHTHSICMWGEEKVYGHVEVEFGQTVRLKTRGNSCLIGK